MQLNMSIILDALKKYHPIATISSDDYEIETVRVYSPKMTRKNSTIYIGKAADYGLNNSDQIVCCHKNDQLLLDTTDLSAVLNDVLAVLDTFSRWEYQNMNLLNGDSVLQDFVDLAETVLARPVFMLDVGQRIQAWSRTFAPTKDSFWDEMIAQGSISTNDLQKINLYFPDRKNKKGIFEITADFFPNKVYHYNFYLQGEWIGHGIMVEEKTKTSKGELSIFELLCGYISEWYQIHMQDQESTLLKHMITSSLQNPQFDHDELYYQLKINGWNENDDLILLQIVSPYEAFHFNVHITHILERSFTNIVAVTTDTSICILANLANVKKEEFLENLIQKVRGSRYYGSISPIFRMGASLYHFYQYTSVSLQHCDKKPGTIYDERQYMLYHILHRLKEESFTDYRHPALSILKKYDEQHHTDFYETLYLYLKNERSSVRTAEALNVHRNSLTYRLKQIQSIINVNLDDYDQRIFLLLSYELDH